MPIPSTFGRRAKDLREARGWTQEQLAQKSGVKSAMISHFETGVRRSASADNLVKLANALEVSLDYLLGRTDEARLSSPRVAAAFRGLEDASAETVDAAMDVVETLVERERRKRREGSGEPPGKDGSTRSE